MKILGNYLFYLSGRLIFRVGGRNKEK